MNSTISVGGLRLPFLFREGAENASEWAAGHQVGRRWTRSRISEGGSLCATLGQSGEGYGVGTSGGCWVIGMSNGEGGTGESCATPSCYPQ